jgi:c-di-GMP-binding flagellar brake protein YcgR
MAENGTQVDQKPFPAQLELEQSGDYSKYLLYSTSEILAVLRALIQKGAMITVHFDEGNSFLLTSMIALSADGREFILDIGSNAEMNRKALLARKLIFTTVVDKVKVQFSLDKLLPTQSEGRPAFLGKVPETLLRLQRREFFRLSTPIANPIRLNATVRRADHSTMHIELPLLDVSGGGVGLMATLDQALLFQKGDTLNDCKMLLPDEGLLALTLCVRNMFSVTTRSGSRHVRIGCEFVGLPPPRLSMLQRYITRVERERKARLSGLV